MSYFSQRPNGFQVPRSNRSVIRIVLGTVVATLMILAILPFTQVLSGDPRDNLRILTIDAVIPPPEPPPPEPPPPPEEDRQEEVRDLDMQPPPLTLSQLESALNPGIGEGLFGGFGLDAFGMAPDVGAEIRIFEMSDLDRQPRRLSGRMPQYPQQMLAQGVEGIVRLRILIDEEGHVTILDVVEASRPEFVQPARQAVATWRFESPTVGGERVRARYVLPLPFRLN